MVALRLEEIKPFDTISVKTSPEPLRWALKEIFTNTGDGLWLVGGTALAGYYAEHRRSDDLDLFALDTEIHRSTILAVKELKKAGADFKKEITTPNFYKAHVELRGHPFTIDIVLDENLHRVGQATKTSEGVFVANLSTLFATKAACLLSRCSEKDLYDLAWLFDRMGGINVLEIVEQGKLIDGGMNVEGMLISLQGANLRREACQFLLEDSKKATDEVYKKISELRGKLLQSLLDYEKKEPSSPDVAALGQAVKEQKKIST